MRRLAVAAAALALALGAGAQAATYHAPRNAWGQPDLGGTWNSDYSMPLEATPGVPLVLNEADAKVFARQMADEVHKYAAFKIDGEVQDLAEHNAETGLGVVRGQRRTRQLVQPADGVLPVTAAARGSIRFVESAIRNSADPPFPTDGPEQRSNWERCLVGQGQPPIAVTTNINPRMIVQTKDAVVVLSEYGPDLRIIPLTDKHGPKVLDGTLGDAIARFDGETLVIETVRLPEKDRIRPVPTFLVPSTAVVEERYTRISDKELVYQYTVKDPSVYTGPWLAEYSLYRTDKPVLEFACHEGNYSLPNILAGAREQERERAAAKKK